MGGPARGSVGLGAPVRPPEAPFPGRSPFERTPSRSASGSVSSGPRRHPPGSRDIPRIAGFVDPPLRDPPAPPAPPGDPWIVVVDDLSVGLVREIWIDSWRWTGAARVTGGLFLRSGIEAEVLPSQLAVSRGTLHWGKETVSRETTGSVRAALPRFDTQAYPGNEVWKIMSGGAFLRGTLDGLAFLAPAGGGPRLAPGGAGTVRARVALRGGRGSARLDVEAAPVVARLGERTVRAAVRANVFARRIDFPGGSVAFDGTRVRLRDVSLEGAAGAPWSGTLEARQARLGLGTALSTRTSRRGWATAGRSWPSCPPARRSGSRGFSISGTSRRRAACARRGVSSRSRRSTRKPARSRSTRTGARPAAAAGEPFSSARAPSPSGSSSERAVRRHASWAPPAGSRRKAGPEGSGRISPGTRRAPCGPADRPSRLRERGCRGGRGPRGAAAAFRARSSCGPASS